MNIDIYLASPRGYCAGVHRAIEILNTAIKKYGTPIYVNHEIIHNKFIINYFEKKGVIFEEDLEKVPKGSIMVFSAHGVGPEFIAKVRAKGIRFIDASCPLVIKVHNEAKDYINKGYEIIYIGSKKHQEALGVKEEDSNNIHIVSSIEDIEKLSLKNTDKLALLTQTTLSLDDTKKLKDAILEKYPSIVFPAAGDICYATTNRQEAVKTLCEVIDLLIIVGSKNSSNSNKLKDIGVKNGITSILIDNYYEIDDTLLFDGVKIGISSGASAPEPLVQELMDYLKGKGAIVKKEIIHVEEKIKFASDIVLQD